MNDYQIFSDSSCDIPESLIQEHDIALIPFYVTFNQEDYYKERSEISNAEFYHKLTEGNIYPKTSLPSVQDYINSFKPALKEGRDILCICLTHKFSGSYQSAVNAKIILEEKYPKSSIVIIDSILATSAQGLLVLQAAYMKEQGYSLEENAGILEHLKNTARIMFTVDTLEYLAKGGRIGKAASLAGNMLNLKPLIQLKDGELIPYSNVRGRKKALEKMLFMAEEYFTAHQEVYSSYDFCITNSVAEEDAAFIKERLEQKTGIAISYPMFQIGVTIGTYTGPGTVGICFVKKFDS